MAEKWQRSIHRDTKKDTKKVKYPWKKSNLSKPENNDLNKQWCVEYGAYSQTQDKIIRKRIVLSEATVDGRLKEAERVIKYLHDYFKNGDIFVEPLDLPGKATKTFTTDGITSKSTMKQALQL